MHLTICTYQTYATVRPVTLMQLRHAVSLFAGLEVTAQNVQRSP